MSKCDCSDLREHVAELKEQLVISRYNEKAAQEDWKLDKVRIDADTKTIRSLLSEVRELTAEIEMMKLKEKK